MDAVAFGAGGERLLFGGEDALARVVDLEGAQDLQLLRGHSRPVTAIGTDRTGRWVATGAADRTVRVWEAGTGALHAVLADQPAGITAIAFSDDGVRLLTVADRSVCVYDLPIRRAVPMLAGHEPAAVYGLRCCGDGRLASADFGGKLRLSDAASGVALGGLRAGKRVFAVAASPAGPLVATAHEGGSVRVWHADTGALVHVLRCSRPTRVTALDVDAAGRRLVARTHRSVDVWDFQTGAPVASIEATGRKGVGAVAVSRDGRLVAADLERGCGVWDVDARTIVSEPVTGAGPTLSLAFGAGGSHLAVGTTRGQVFLCDPRTGEVLHELSGHTDKVYAVVFSPDGARLASGGDDRSIILWDVVRGESLFTLRGHRAFVYALTFSPDGETLYSGSGEGAIGVWSTLPSSGWRHAAARLERRHAGVRSMVERLRAEEDDDTAAVAERARRDPDLDEATRRAVLQVNLALALRAAAQREGAEDEKGELEDVQ